ncbi:Rpn family recombination-promoting nuclease/putative transposase [Paenibacillus sp. GCM10023248]|uniref:Rpn family recombination-promoting nuclease/putative transposase n=1 Tax=Bacillales TaxID=1385 RepID=UPI00237834F8|nr:MULTISPECIES: Rpn family recombination-promoting nuclease/putative transposase [Bacillales]MDD9265786.1 Rpn family recombination-promoting nuclease/putative transposase [Paenibacillus sp. MAHUQ-63]MDR6879027.1 putative transposase/invertase (TIGR01784 family) [Bacillus sp. 3255]
MRDLLDPKNDFVFKRIFGSEENKDVLLAFLNRTFQEAGEPQLSEIILMNPYTDKDSPQDKQSIFDIQAKTAEGKLINIEMQLFNRYDNEKRTLYYWSKQYASQLEEGQPYKNLKKCVTINILNFSILPSDRYHNVFHLREDRSGISLTDDLEIHFLELSKLSHNQTTASGGLLSWLLFLKSDNTDNWEVLKMQEPELGKAMTVLEFLSQDEDARRIYELRQKALHDEASLREGAREEGERKGKLDVAIKMIAKGMDLASISELTGISIEELKKIAQAQ